MVFVHPEDLAAIDVVRAAAEDVFKAPPRYVPRDRVKKYDRAVFRALAGAWDLTIEDEGALADAAYVEGNDRASAEAAILAAVKERRSAHGRSAPAPLARGGRTRRRTSG